MNGRLAILTTGLAALLVAGTAAAHEEQLGVTMDVVDDLDSSDHFEMTLGGDAAHGAGVDQVAHESDAVDGAAHDVDDGAVNDVDDGDVDDVDDGATNDVAGDDVDDVDHGDVNDTDDGDHGGGDHGDTPNVNDGAMDHPGDATDGTDQTTDAV